MTPLWMIPASLGAVVLLGSIFSAQAALRHRRAARRRAMRASGLLPSMEAVAGEPAGALADEGLLPHERTPDVHGRGGARHRLRLRHH